MIIDKRQAILSLLTGVKASLNLDENGNIMDWDGETTQPTEAEFQAEVARLQAEYDSQEYARDRASAYPSLQDQADMQYWDAVNGTTTWQDAIAKVKADYPKG